MSNKLTKIEPDKINFLKELKDGSVVFSITTRNFWRVVNRQVTIQMQLN